jgi:hypothetical protein
MGSGKDTNISTILNLCRGISAGILLYAGLRFAGHTLSWATNKPLWKYPWKYISGARLDLPATKKPYRLKSVSPHDVSTKILGTLYMLLTTTL